MAKMSTQAPAKRFVYEVRLEVFFEEDGCFEFDADFTCETNEPQQEVDAHEEKMLTMVERAVREYREANFA